jgi:NAD(P)-dependent dehydrogenase (short-subunit alcohol dehydrogenase family)
VAAAASRCTDVTLLINNAGIAAVAGFLSVDSIESARAQLETNFFGPLRGQAFAPVLAANGGVLS